MNQSWISMHEAITISGHKTTSGLDQWIRRWNYANPKALVLRRPRMVDATSLKAALRAQARQFTPGLRNREGIIKTILKVRRLRNR